ncbi:ATP-binding protein [Streptomyces sp. NPDC017254]|uniref:ATP-binding protein n=1 Tax=unclassified Streptomyces TaxID=2593676 RepID=UPI0037BDDF63
MAELSSLSQTAEFVSVVVQRRRAGIQAADVDQGEVTPKLTRWELGHLSDPAALALTELVANVVRHVPGRRCSVLILREPYGLRVEVADAVPGAVHAKAGGPLDEGGRGLVLVEAVTDRWGVVGTADGKTVWFECDA